jgi:hypothetical protein
MSVPTLQALATALRTDLDWIREHKRLDCARVELRRVGCAVLRARPWCRPFVATPAGREVTPSGVTASKASMWWQWPARGTW